MRTAVVVSMQTKGGVVALLVALLAGVALWSCERDTPREAPEEPTEQTTAADDDGDLFAGVECATVDESEPEPGDVSTIFGAVWAPDGRLAAVGDGGSNLLLRSARADEDDAVTSVGADVRVWLARADELGAPAGRVLVETRTDDYGRWCLAIPDEVSAGPHLVVSAEGEKERLRRPVADEGLLEIEARYEAVLRLLVEEGHRPPGIGAETYRSLEVRADKALDSTHRPVGARAGQGVEPFVARLMEIMGDDRALMEAIDDAHDG